MAISIGQIRDEAAKISRSLESDARIAGGRVDGLTASLEQLKKQATSTNGQDVQLRALEREAKAQRDLLETYLGKYREASTRESIDSAPAEGRIISRAIVSNTPAYPKKLPIVLIATLATLLLSSGLVVTGELLRQTAPRAIASLVPAPVAARQEPVVDPVVEETPAPLQPEMTADADVSEFVEIGQLAESLRAAGSAAKKVTVLGTASGDAITLSTLTLARHLARDARVVVVDLAASSPTIAAVSVDPNGARSCRIDAGAGLVCAGHHARQALAAASGLGRSSRLRSQPAAVAAGDARDRCLAARLRSRAGRRRQCRRFARGAADGECPRRRGARCRRWMRMHAR